MKKTLSRMALIALTFASLSNIVRADIRYGPTPYLQASDSPFYADIVLGNVGLETFEDNLFNISGVIASDGITIGPGGQTDSVDGDDGFIDGSGTNGHSFFASGSITFSFTGTLPTQAGIVWTDGGAGSIVTFRAFDENGISLGTFPNHTAGNENNGNTDEDRFFGAFHAGGISRIFISNDSGGIEVDHLQFGTASAVPEPTMFGLAAVGLAAIGISRRRRISN